MWNCQDLHAQSAQPFYRQIPAHLHTALPERPETQEATGMMGNCFSDIDLSMYFSWVDGTTLLANIKLDLGGDKHDYFCTEHLQFSTAFSDHYDYFWSAGSHELQLVFDDVRDVIDIQKSGLRLFNYCASSFEMLSSTFSTALLYVGGGGSSTYLPVLGARPTEYQKHNNQLMLQEFSQFWFNERVIEHVLVDESQFRTGDLFIQRRWTGRPSVSMLLSGSLASAVAMVVEANGQHWVIEAQPEPWFSSQARGVQIHPLWEWMSILTQAESEVAWLPLNPSIRTLHEFDTDALFAWVNDEAAGSDYSLAKEFFAAVDNVEQGFPMPFSAEALPIFLRLFDKFADSPNMPELIEGLQKRYAQVFSEARPDDHLDLPLDLDEVIAFTASELDMTLQELVVIPEQDSWTYSSGKRAFTSAEFVVTAYQHLGVFDGFEINASEFTPQNVAELDIFDKQFQLPENCAEADIHLPYCQLMGPTRLYLKNYSTRAIADWMNQSCPNSFVSRFESIIGC